MLSSEYLRSLSVRSCHFDSISAFDRYILESFALVNFRVFFFSSCLFHLLLYPEAIYV